MIITKVKEGLLLNQEKNLNTREKNRKRSRKDLDVLRLNN